MDVVCSKRLQVSSFILYIFLTAFPSSLIFLNKLCRDLRLVALKICSIHSSTINCKNEKKKRTHKKQRSSIKIFNYNSKCLFFYAKRWTIGKAPVQFKINLTSKSHINSNNNIQCLLPICEPLNINHINTNTHSLSIFIGKRGKKRIPLKRWIFILVLC